MTDHWLDRLSEYLDDELEAMERAQLEAHMSDCAECTRALEQLRVVVQRARALRDHPPAHDLWSGIAARIDAGEAAPAPVVDLQQFAARRKLRLSFSVPQLIAAGIILMLVSGASVWLALSSARRAGVVSPIENGGVVTRSVEIPANEDRNVVAALPGDSNTDTIVDVETRVATASRAPSVAPRQAASGGRTLPGASESAAPQMRNVATSPDRPYDTAVADLQTVLREGRSQLDPKTVRALEDNLRVIDQAIAAARSALAGDSANVYLNEHLASNMQRKLELLRRATAIVSGQS
jgi:anti-sigma factor RsiW